MKKKEVVPKDKDTQVKDNKYFQVTSPSFNKNQWLLVEDDLDYQEFFKMAYAKAGIKNELVILNNGEVALDYIRITKKRPFVIISDINMPRMNGLELLNKIKNDEPAAFKGIPFLILSSSTSEEEIELTFKNNSQGYFRKTITIKDQTKIILSIQNYWSQCKHRAFDQKE
jgi:CheY-like chemotaxis protein